MPNAAVILPRLLSWIAVVASSSSSRNGRCALLLPPPQSQPPPQPPTAPPAAAVGERRRRKGTASASSTVVVVASALHAGVDVSVDDDGIGSAIRRDRNAVRRQLGYVPSNYVEVSARTSATQEGSTTPVAIRTYPLLLSQEQQQGRSREPRRRRDRAAAEETRRRLVGTQSRNVASTAVDNNGNEDTRAAFSTAAVATLEDVGTPFPTLYWLSNPEIGRAVADLERRGCAKLIENELLLRRRSGNGDFRDSDAFLLLKCHEEYARARWESLLVEDRNRISDLAAKSRSGRRIYDMLRHSGVAGTNVTRAVLTTTTTTTASPSPLLPFVPSVKCLHAHYADYRSVLAEDDDKENLHCFRGVDSYSDCATTTGRTVLNPVGRRVHELLREEFPSLVL